MPFQVDEEMSEILQSLHSLHVMNRYLICYKLSIPTVEPRLLVKWHISDYRDNLVLQATQGTNEEQFTYESSTAMSQK